MPTFDASATRGGNGTSSYSWSHVVADQMNRLMLVAIGSNDALDTGVTFNGDAMTLLEQLNYADEASVGVYYLLNPDVGTFDVTVTFGGNRLVTAVSNSFYGVDQLFPLGTQETAEGSLSAGATATLSPASNTSQLVWDAIVINTQGAGVDTMTIGADQTERGNIEDSSVTRTICSTEAGGAGTTAMSWTLDDSISPGGQDHVHLAVAINPAVDRGGFFNFLPY